MTDEVSTASIGVEDTGARHRRERRELQATVQQLKKSINKNDKTRKKKVDGEIQALEDAFAKRWANFNENATPTQLAETAVAIVPEQAPSEASETVRFLSSSNRSTVVSYSSSTTNSMYRGKHVD